MSGLLLGLSHFNPRSPHGERHKSLSTHTASSPISIHAPRTGSDLILTIHIQPTLPFQSTLPARGATPCPLIWRVPMPISIHAPRTGSDRVSNSASIWRILISIHAPRTGSDVTAYIIPDCGIMISIHAPRTGSDLEAVHKLTDTINFNPRSPHGERRDKTENIVLKRRFQSTLPARGATYRVIGGMGGRGISIHAPRTGSDVGIPSCNVDKKISIHAPRTGSDENHTAFNAYQLISIHAPRTGSDDKPHMRYTCLKKISIHAPRTGSDVALLAEGTNAGNFNPRSPHGERPMDANTDFS